MGKKPIYGPKTWLRDKNALALFFVGPQGQTNDRSILLKVQTNKKNFVRVRFPIFVFRPPYSPLLLLSFCFVTNCFIKAIFLIVIRWMWKMIVSWSWFLVKINKIKNMWIVSFIKNVPDPEVLAAGRGKIKRYLASVYCAK